MINLKAPLWPRTAGVALVPFQQAPFPSTLSIESILLQMSSLEGDAVLFRGLLYPPI